MGFGLAKCGAPRIAADRWAGVDARDTASNRSPAASPPDHILRAVGPTPGARYWQIGITFGRNFNFGGTNKN